MVPPSSQGWAVPERYWRWLASPSAKLALLWIVCLAYAGQRLYHARTEFGNDPRATLDLQRGDGNSGHTQIDFGGQWVLGRLVVTGHARELYHRQAQWPVVWQGFPPEGESPYNRRNAGPGPLRDPDVRGEVIKHDAEWLMYSFMGHDSPCWDEAASAAVVPVGVDATHTNPFATVALLTVSRDRLTPKLVEEVNRPAIGGPLYPPIHPFYYAPFGAIESPQRAYAVFQWVSLGLTFLAGLGVSRLSRGRIWWPAATLLILLYPGFRSGLDLAQNQVLSLVILVWGWVLASRGRDGWAGLVWGLLAFKPVWAATFFLVPLLMGRWRFCAAMAGMGLALIVATVPVVGVQAWMDWLAVGQEASRVYGVNKNWIGLSRDLSGIPRRLLIDFSLPEAERANPTADWAGWVALAVVLVPTVGLYLWRANRRFRTGLGIGFLLLGAYLCCYRFMYYDALLSVLPLAVLFADPRRFLQPRPFVIHPANDAQGPVGIAYLNSFPLTILALLIVVENWLLHVGLEGTFGLGYFSTVTTTPEGATARHVPRLTLELGLFQAWDTILLLGLWAWCAVRLLLGSDWGEPAYAAPERSASSAAPMSGERISDSPTSTA